MAQARTEPPSERRSAEAKAFGHAPRTVIVAAALGVASASALLHVLQGDLSAALAELYRAPLLAIARDVAPDPQAHLRGVFAAFAPYVALLLLGAGLASALALALVQGFRFRVLRRKPRYPFAKVTNTRPLTASLVALGTVIVTALSVHDALWRAQTGLSEVLARLGLRLSALLLLVAACDAALARAAFWRSLWMTRQQRRDEDREAYGSFEMRSERERIRRELGGRAS